MADEKYKRDEIRHDEEESDENEDTTDDDAGNIFLQILNSFHYNFSMLW